MQFSVPLSSYSCGLQISRVKNLGSPMTSVCYVCIPQCCIKADSIKNFVTSGIGWSCSNYCTPISYSGASPMSGVGRCMVEIKTAQWRP